jgi:hypothetical protein
MSFTFLPSVGKLIARLMLALFCSIEHDPKLKPDTGDNWYINRGFPPTDKDWYATPEPAKCSNPRDHEKRPLCHKANTGDTKAARHLWGPECPVHGPSAQVRFDSVPSPINDESHTVY